MPEYIPVGQGDSSTMHKFAAAYRNIFFPKPVKPPFLHVCQVGDPVLRSKALPVPPEDIPKPETKQVISQMRQVMKTYDAVGLAAPQIGVPLRIITLEFSPKRKKEFGEEVYAAREMSILPFTVVINPHMEILDYKKITFPEACESLRGYSAMVPRFKAVKLVGQDQSGEEVELETEGWLARIIQHEMEHLDGKLYIDSMDVKSFQNDAWHRINVHQGRVQIQFYKK
ncbi:peptide deformylase, mitochondrial isoform X1 [Penaeus vannamei]|uniref:peptide deformylase, mitochondrial isoform X1 n=2 Tax=Penaeus vannamei TaxID=6689 RepID=UPI00387F5364